MKRFHVLVFSIAIISVMGFMFFNLILFSSDGFSDVAGDSMTSDQSSEETDLDEGAENKAFVEGRSSSVELQLEDGLTGFSQVESVNGSFCSIVRPGDVLGVNCIVSSIDSEGVSIVFTNENEDVVGAKVSLEKCRGELYMDLGFHDSAEYAFSCSIEDLFYEDSLVIDYHTKNKGISKGYGVVSSPVL